MPLTAAVLLGATLGAAPAEPARPNVLFIAVDDLRPELGAYGAEVIQTPNIDRLAAGGATFLHAYVQQAVCNPSRASLLTGRRPDAIGVHDLQTDFRTTVPDVVTLPQHFKEHGYHAVAIGKIFHNNLPDPLSWSEPKWYLEGYPFDPDAVYRDPENVARVEARKAEILARGEEQRHLDRFGEWYLKTVATECVDLPDDAWYDGAQTTRAIARLPDLVARDEPFFLAVGYYRPHLPFNAPERYWDLYDPAAIPLAADPFPPEGAPPMALNTGRELRGYQDFTDLPLPVDAGLDEARARHLKHGYYASVSYVDAQVGRLLDALEANGVAGNTIVVLWGDHGWKLGEHRSWCKMTNYEIDARAPLIVRDPRRIRAGLRLPQLVEFVDLYPTLCELAGLPLPEGLEGTSAVPLLDDPTLPGKRAVFHQFLREGIWVAPDGVVYMGRAVRTARHRYVEWAVHETGEVVARELYDLAADPGEDHNLAGRPDAAAVMAQLATLLHLGWRAVLPAPR